MYASWELSTAALVVTVFLLASLMVTAELKEESTFRIRRAPITARTARRPSLTSPRAQFALAC